MRFVTVFWPLKRAAPRGEALQTAGGARLVVDCRVKPAGVAGHVKIMSPPERTIVSCGAMTAGRERLNMVPLPKSPPDATVPYRALPIKTKPL